MMKRNHLLWTSILIPVKGLSEVEGTYMGEGEAEWQGRDPQKRANKVHLFKMFILNHVVPLFPNCDSINFIIAVIKAPWSLLCKCLGTGSRTQVKDDWLFALPVLSLNCVITSFGKNGLQPLRTGFQNVRCLHV